jgi:predicted transcriptional regulator
VKKIAEQIKVDNSLRFLERESLIMPDRDARVRLQEITEVLKSHEKRIRELERQVEDHKSLERLHNP